MVVGIDTWDIKGITKTDTPEAAVNTAFELLQ
jgi:hypothetical protein